MNSQHPVPCTPLPAAGMPVPPPACPKQVYDAVSIPRSLRRSSSATVSSATVSPSPSPSPQQFPPQQFPRQFWPASLPRAIIVSNRIQGLDRIQGDHGGQRIQGNRTETRTKSQTVNGHTVTHSAFTPICSSLILVVAAQGTRDHHILPRWHLQD